jgi:hypothetical protein
VSTATDSGDGALLCANASEGITSIPSPPSRTLSASIAALLLSFCVKSVTSISSFWPEP